MLRILQSKKVFLHLNNFIKHGLEHLNLSIDYWQRALTIINLSLSNNTILTNQPDLIQHDEANNQTRLNDLKQKIEFLLTKIDINSNASELQLVLEQEQSTQPSLVLINNTTDQGLPIFNRSESVRVQQELRTVLSVQIGFKYI